MLLGSAFIGTFVFVTLIAGSNVESYHNSRYKKH